MQTHISPKIKLIADALASILQQGFEVDASTRHFIESTLLDGSIKTIAAIIKKPAEFEAESLLELLFFPDEAMQLSLETILEQNPLELGEEEKLYRYLRLHPLPTLIRFDNGREVITCNLPPQCLRPFVTRLCLGKNQDQGLIDSVNRHAPSSLRNLIKVRLRNSKGRLSKRSIGILGCFFEKMDPEADDYMACCEFLIAYLDTLKQGRDLYESLCAYQRRCGRQYQQAVKFEKQFSQNNFETLLLTGVRAPYCDKNDLLHTIRIIDRIIATVF